MIGRPRKLDVMAQIPWKMVLAATACLFVLLGTAGAQGGGELRFCLRTEPKTFDPLKVEDDAAVSIRYLSGGVLLRMNWRTHGRFRKMAGRSPSSFAAGFLFPMVRHS